VNDTGASHHERQAAGVWDAIMEGNAAALEYLQDEAGLTRTGYHRGTGAESMAELGKWEHARNWVIGSFRQHTSRTGDPQLHVHNLVLAKVLTERDGKWRKLDSKALYRFQGAAAAVAAAVTETALTRSFGVAWVRRRDGHGREIAGISQALMDTFSSRRQTIVEEARRIADQRELEHGRRPDARQMDPSVIWRCGPVRPNPASRWTCGCPVSSKSAPSH
jgi:TrwC relaxase